MYRTQISWILIYPYIPVCTAQGGGGTFKDSKLSEVAVNHGSQSKSTDGSQSGWWQRSVVVVVIVVAI